MLIIAQRCPPIARQHRDMQLRAGHIWQSVSMKLV
jgi:hypothetical protein